MHGRELWVAELDLLSGDVDNDGSIQFADFVILANNFGRTGATRADGDLNDDRIVDFADFLILANSFEKSRKAATLSISAAVPTENVIWLD